MVDWCQRVVNYLAHSHARESSVFKRVPLPWFGHEQTFHTRMKVGRKELMGGTIKLPTSGSIFKLCTSKYKENELPNVNDIYASVERTFLKQINSESNGSWSWKRGKEFLTCGLSADKVSFTKPTPFASFIFEGSCMMRIKCCVSMFHRCINWDLPKNDDKHW